MEPQATVVQKENKVAAIVSYLTIVGLIIGYILHTQNRSKLSTLHLSQSIGIVLSGIVLGFIAIVPVLGWLIAIIGGFLLLIMWIVGLVNAINGKAKPVPILGKKYKSWFQNI